MPPPSSFWQSTPDGNAGVVLAEVERVVTSPAFGGSARQVKLLRFLVEEVLAGRGAGLSPVLIATSVFGRSASFDPAEDTIVRVEMSKLRRALERHYATASTGGLRIDLPRGAYAPVVVAPSQAEGGRGPRSAPRPSLPSDPERELPGLPVSQRSAVVDAAGGPVLAVLPFTGINAVSTVSLRSPTAGGPPSDSGAPGARGRALAHGLTDRVSQLVAVIPGVTMVSRATTLDEAAERGARYVLEGSVRFLPGALRVSAKLHDVARGVQVWGNTFDRAGADANLFAAEDEIAREITIATAALPQGALHVIEAQERAGRPPRSAYEVALLFLRWFITFDPRTEVEIVDASRRLLGDAPDQGLLLGALSLVHGLALWTRDGEPDDRRRALDLARRAVTIEPALVTAHQALALALLEAGDGRGALAAAETAVALGGPLVLNGMVMALAGGWGPGVAVLRTHVALMKQFPRAVRHVLALDAYRRGDYATALAEAESIATPVLAWDPLDRAIALARLGRFPEAKAAAAALAALLPDSVRHPRAMATRLTADPALREEIVTGLRLAGLE